MDKVPSVKGASAPTPAKVEKENPVKKAKKDPTYFQKNKLEIIEVVVGLTVFAAILTIIIVGASGGLKNLKLPKWLQKAADLIDVAGIPFEFLIGGLMIFKLRNHWQKNKLSLEKRLAALEATLNSPQTSSRTEVE